MQDLERPWERLWAHVSAGLGFIDLGALTVVALFFLLGLCKGMVWQIGRLLAVLSGYGVAARFGPDVAARVLGGDGPMHAYVYLAYVAVFLATFVVVALLARGVRALLQNAGLGLFDRLGGGLFGVGTGAAIVVGLLALVLMFGRRLPLHDSVQSSRALALTRTALTALGDLVPAPIQAAFARSSARASAAALTRGACSTPTAARQ
jgi:uncharacterized membrane protein required for colicin V production